MSEASERIKNKIITNSAEIKGAEVPAKQNNKGKIWGIPFRLFSSLIGLNIDKAKKKGNNNSNSKNGNYYHETHSTHPYPHDGGSTRSGFDSYKYNPVEMDNMRIYLQGQDGKGDPRPPCDCDHDR